MLKFGRVHWRDSHTQLLEFIYSGSHVLAVGVIPLLAFWIVISNSLLLPCDSLPTSSTWKLGLAWTWVDLDISRRCDHKENYIQGYIFLGLNILSRGWVLDINAVSARLSVTLTVLCFEKDSKSNSQKPSSNQSE